MEARRQRRAVLRRIEADAKLSKAILWNGGITPSAHRATSGHGVMGLPRVVGAEEAGVGHGAAKSGALKLGGRVGGWRDVAAGRCGIGRAVELGGATLEPAQGIAGIGKSSCSGWPGTGRGPSGSAPSISSRNWSCSSRNWSCSDSGWSEIGISRPGGGAAKRFSIGAVPCWTGCWCQTRRNGMTRVRGFQTAGSTVSAPPCRRLGVLSYPLSSVAAALLPLRTAHATGPHIETD